MRPATLLLLAACSGSEPSAEAPEPADTDPCPVLTASANSTRGGGVEPSVNGEGIAIDLDALEAALPENAAGLPRAEPSTWNRGDAGHWSPGVVAFYTHEGSRVGAQVTDLVHVCTCDSGMGAVLQGRRAHSVPGARPLEIAGHPAVAAEPANRPPELEVWVNDRCSVRVWAAPTDVLERLAGALDWPALAAACPAR